MQRRSNWAIFGGKIRDPEHCVRKLNTLQSWRARGLIDGVVFATWIGELDAYPEVLSALEVLNASIVELGEPMLRLPGHVLHQKLALHRALDLVPDGAHVLRLRPDLIELNRSIEDFLVEEPSLEVSPPDGWPAIFEERVVVLEGFLLAPLYLNDMLFYGVKSAILQLLDMSLETEVLFTNMAPEQWFFTPPFAKQIPLLRSYMRAAIPFQFENADWSQRCIAGHMDSPFFTKVFLTYLTCLRSYFRIGFALPRVEPGAIARRTATGVLTGIQEFPGVQFRRNLMLPVLSHSAFLGGVLDGMLASDPYLERLGAMLPEVLDWEFQRNWTDTALQPKPELQDYVTNVAIPLGSNSARIDIANDPENKKFKIISSGSRWQVSSGTNEVMVLTAEINVLRRQIESLQTALGRAAPLD